jgi:hypothetical protein
MYSQKFSKNKGRNNKFQKFALFSSLEQNEEKKLKEKKFNQ